jgi:hypothetical protein
MSVVSFKLENLNLNVDEDYLFTLPSITINNGGQIISITESDIEDNVEIQTAAILSECASIEAKLTPNLETLQEQTTEIEDQIIDLKSNVNTLLSNIDIQIDLVNTLIEDINIATTGFEIYLDNLDTIAMSTLLSSINTENYWNRRQKIPLLNITLDAGIYVYTSNWNSQYTIETLGGVQTQTNTDTRYKLSYAYVDVVGGGNICSSLCHSSGHNGLNITHSSAMCFELTETTACSFGIMCDIACLSFTGVNDLVFIFLQGQTQQYPKALSINQNIGQVVRIA